MKKILFICAMIFSLKSLAEGNSVLNGGDGISSEVVFMMRTILSDLSQENLTEQNRKILIEIRDNIKTILVYSKDHTFLADGQEVDAINEPLKKKITISQTRWIALQNRMLRRLRLVVHEYMGVLGYDDTNYSLSEPLISSLQQKTIAKITSQAEFSKHILNLINLFESYRASKVANRAQLCLDVGEMKSEWRSALSFYDAEAFYRDPAGANFSVDGISGILEDFRKACIKPLVKDTIKTITQLSFNGTLYASQLYFNLGTKPY